MHFRGRKYGYFECNIKIHDLICSTFTLQVQDIVFCCTFITCQIMFFVIVFCVSFLVITATTNQKVVMRKKVENQFMKRYRVLYAFHLIVRLSSLCYKLKNYLGSACFCLSIADFSILIQNTYS